MRRHLQACGVAGWVVWVGSFPALARTESVGPAKSTVASRMKMTGAPQKHDARGAVAVVSPSHKVERARFDVGFLKAKQLFQTGQYVESVVLLTRTLAETQPTLDQQVQAYELLASGYVALGQRDLSIGVFLALLRLRPDFELDPVKVSPKIRAVLDEARTRL